MHASTRERAVDEVARLARCGLDLVAFWDAAARALGRVVPHLGAPCWYTLDPASLLITSHVNAEMPEIPAEWLAQEYFEDDVNQLAAVARSARGVSTLHEATSGDPTTSPRWHANMAYGGDQELIAALRTRSGDVWGALGLYREPGRPLFDAAEVAFVQSVAPALAEGARRALLVGEATDPEGPNAPGMVVLGPRWELEFASPGAGRWLGDLPDGDWDAGRLPSVVLAVAARALGPAEETGGGGAGAVALPALGDGAGGPQAEGGGDASARVRGRSGRWLAVHGLPLASETAAGAAAGDGGGRVAVVVEPADPVRLAPLLMRAHGLTEREQDVTRLVLQGHSTAEVAAALYLSPHTVQQHLKAIFDKTGVRSRRDLVGKVFFAHYEPRVRDNEARALRNAPLRGGPFDPAV